MPARSAAMLIVFARRRENVAAMTKGFGTRFRSAAASPSPRTMPIRAHIICTAAMSGQVRRAVQRRLVPSCAPAMEYVAIPEGSSSAAPVMSPGPSTEKKRRGHLRMAAGFGTLLRTEIVHVHVRAEPRVIGQVPAVVVRVLVDHDLVAVPEPVAHVVVLERRDLKSEAAEPESFPGAAAEPEDVLWTETSREPAMCPDVVEVVLGIAAPGIMSNPAAVIGVDVRSDGMSGLVGDASVAGFGPRNGHWLSRSGRGAMARYEAAPHVRRAAFRWLRTLLLLGDGRHRADQQHPEKSGEILHDDLSCRGTRRRHSLQGSPGAVAHTATMRKQGRSRSGGSRAAAIVTSGESAGR